MDNKAVWDDETTEIFIHACLDQVYKKERTGLAFTKEGWKSIVSTFNEKTGKSYDRKQLKNRLDILKKDFKIWDSLLKETGVGFDPANNRVTATEAWWTEKLQVKPGYKKFKRSGLKFERELRIIFKDVMATGDDMFSPCSTQPQYNQEEGNDVYRPAVDEEEGSGDSEDEHFGVDPALSTGVTNEMASIGLATSAPSDAGPSAFSFLQKRKRGEGSSKSKKQKVPAVNKIADAISTIANVTVDRAVALTETDESSIREVMKYLMSFDEFKRDRAFGVRYMKALESKARREFFVTLKGDPGYLLGKYYLVDSGYPTSVGFLGPYRCERYHLPEFRNQRGFRNPNEAFNFYHSSLRCTIERTFGVWKNRFEILQKMRKYSFHTQVRIVCATMAIHNFIRRNSQTDEDFRNAENENLVDEDNSQDQEPPSTNNPRTSTTQMNHVRDTIRNRIVRDLRSN